MAKSTKSTAMLKWQKVGAWSVLVLALLYYTGLTINTAEAPTAPPSPLDIIWPVVVFTILPLLWLKKVNDAQNEKRVLSSRNVIVALTVISLAVTSWGFYRDAQKYYVYQDELAAQKFAAVNVLYKQRFDLVPNVAKSAKALADQEKALVDNITSARTAFLRNQSLNSQVNAINDFNKALTEISINVESYPNLKSDQGFLQLIKVLEESEAQLVIAKNDYNQQVTALNTQSRTFPYNMLAGSFIDDPVKTRIDESVDPRALDAKQLLNNLN